MNRMRALLLAARLRTLPAAAAPVVLGSAAALGDDAFAPLPAAAALVGALLIQLGTNFANDLFDAAKGADGPDRLGPTRAVAAGLLTSREMAVATTVTFLAAAAVGAWLTLVGGWPILVIGVAAIISGIAYTGGPWPLGYHGLGDAFVFVFFGPVAVAGTYWVQAGRLRPEVILAGVVMGLLCTAILVVNNVRDLDSDARVGKRTLAVRMGRRATRTYYTLLLVAAYCLVAALATAPLALLPLITLPLAVKLARTVARQVDGPPLNAALAGTARLLALVSLLWAPAWLQGVAG